ncbi:predicted protein [Postia placenta Mad-698-R]|uniref:BTB domain-containing protein n=1 Tax=Postia placenta MAD-698-R-SB12 TaxID=670580 RepID=A0A1X6NH70_9APHY|nr:hypothetical protein POSPLADRAFT_1129143 [Postia placenta MAD-698-R-SB12]EED82908.1 predicted protein [Postia placenta Mad-698-R]OSX67872.1 hypothetical protein POSPLADRAFT_1129143 [Postia placenta MAD-698-R-SB12]
MATPHAASPARGPTPADLQSHLYQSFLTRKTADVALRVRGSWHAIYKLHRVILIQAGFFQSLFTSGFVESKAKLASSRRAEPDVIDMIVFDDPNITRADNTRVCIARLYGGGPPLHVASSLIPTPSQPLTPAFPYPSSARSSSTPAGHHRATPRFLLSLLATSLFLSMPAVASEALQMILSTVGPYTAVRYLHFALGHGIGPPDNDEPGDGHEPAVGLESVAELALAMRAEPDSGSSQEDELCKEGPASATSDDSGSDMDVGTDDYEAESRRAPEPAYVYGAVSNKIGEAAACWLARWGADILHCEEDVTRGHAQSKSEDQGGGRKRTSTAPSRFAERARNGSAVGGADTREMAVPVVWRCGGLDARWVRGLLSSDALFVRGERERYEMAKTVVEMRRKEGIDEEEEKEWEALFRTGIYYENMILDDVIAISRDASPSTGQHFVPLSVLQASHWAQDVLRHRITARPASGPLSPPLSPSQRDKELGIALSASDVASLVAQERDTSLYPVPGDSSIRIGDTAGIDGASMDQLFDLGSPSKMDAPKKTVPTSEANFFGLQQQRFPASTIASFSGSPVSPVTPGTSKWSPHPPYRFSVEFWDVDSLKEKSRLHSHTVWYAGSLYNVYVQVVRKKGVQLGVYLHRQSSVDPLPASSAPSAPAARAPGQTQGQGLQVQNRPPSASVSTPRPPSLHSPSQGYSGSSSSSTTLGAGNTLPATAPAVSPQQPYRDQRASVSAYFAIACASATGASLTRFTSAPDVFSVSQSWGWKSSSLRTEEYIEVGPDGQPREGRGAPAGREVSLRATVVLGVV